MSNPQQPPADGWQPPHSPPQEEQPVYRPNEQPPGQEPPPWSPESQPQAHPGQQPPMEDEGTVKYTQPGYPSQPQGHPSQPPGHPSQPPGHPSQPQAPFGPPPGVPVSPFDAPPPGVPASGMPAQGHATGMPPVSSVPASGMPVSPGQGQFGPQGGQLVPVSSGPGGQPWGGAQPGQIQRKKKKGGRGPLWILLIGIAVIAGALGVGGFILFNPDSDPDEPGDGDQTGTIENQTVEPAAVGDPGSGLYFITGDGSAEENSDLPEALPEGTGVRAGEASATVGLIDLEAIGAQDAADADDPLNAVAAAFDTSLAATAGGEASGAEAVSYWVDARQATFHTFTVGETTVLTAVIDLGDGTYAGYAGFATTEDEIAAVEAMRLTLQFGEPEM